MRALITLNVTIVMGISTKSSPVQKRQRGTSNNNVLQWCRGSKPIRITCWKSQIRYMYYVLSDVLSVCLSHTHKQCTHFFAPPSHSLFVSHSHASAYTLFFAHTQTSTNRHTCLGTCTSPFSRMLLLHHCKHSTKIQIIIEINIFVGNCKIISLERIYSRCNFNKVYYANEWIVSGNTKLLLLLIVDINYS